MILKAKPTSGYLVNMKIRATDRFELISAKLCKKNSNLGSKIDDTIRLLASNPNHPSLRLHKIHTNTKDSWSISVDMKTRIIFVYTEYGILLVGIGTHDQVY